MMARAPLPAPTSPARAGARAVASCGARFSMVGANTGSGSSNSVGGGSGRNGSNSSGGDGGGSSGADVAVFVAAKVPRVIETAAYHNDQPQLDSPFTPILHSPGGADSDSGDGRDHDDGAASTDLSSGGNNSGGGGNNGGVNSTGGNGGGGGSVIGGNGGVPRGLFISDAFPMSSEMRDDFGSLDMSFGLGELGRSAVGGLGALLAQSTGGDSGGVGIIGGGGSSIGTPMGSGGVGFTPIGGRGRGGRRICELSIFDADDDDASGGDNGNRKRKDFVSSLTAAAAALDETAEAPPGKWRHVDPLLPLRSPLSPAAVTEPVTATPAAVMQAPAHCGALDSPLLRSAAAKHDQLPSRADGGPSGG
ncbi:unnamed protein product, partial [Phaeothamnion confervicola]